MDSLHPFPVRLALPLLALAAATGLRAATEITFRAGDGRLAPEDTADAQLNQVSPAKVNGSGTSRELAVKHDAGGEDNRVVLIAFRNLTGPDRVPSGAVVQRATLRLHCRDGGHDQDVILVESAWAEKTATWGSVFATASKGERIGTLPSPQAGKTHEVDVLVAVRRWVADPGSNFGLMLVSTGSGGGKTGDPVLWSSAQEKDESLRPMLTIAYDPPGSTPVPAPAPGATPAVAVPGLAPSAARNGPRPSRRVALAGDGWVTRGGAEAALSSLLGSGHTVRSFGAEGATALPSDAAWKDSAAARDLAAFQPQVIVLMLGTSDTRAPTRGNLAGWGAAYRDIVLGLQQGRGLESVLLCTPVVEAADTEAGADAALASDRLEVPLRLAAVETGAVVVDTALAARGGAARGITPTEAAAAAVAETLLGRSPDLRLLEATKDTAPPPAPEAKIAPAPAPEPSARAASAPAPRMRVALAGDAPLPDADVAALLAKELGSEHEVRAFHLPSGRLFHQGGKPFSRSTLPAELKAWQPAVVLLTLGQDQGHSTSTSELNALERELRAVVNTVGQHSPRPRILLCQPLSRPDLAGEAREEKSVAPAVDRLGKSFRLTVVPAADVKPTTKPQDPRVIEARARACAKALAAAVRNESPSPKESP